MRGGYKIIDFKDINITTGVGVKIEGIYESIEGNYRKPLLLTGLTIGGVEQADIFVQFVVSEDSFKTEVAQGSIVIMDDDTVSYLEN